MSSSSESEHEDDPSVGSRSVEEEFDEEAWREELRLSKLRVARAKCTNLFRQVKGNDPTLTKLRMCGELNVRYLNMKNYGLERLGEVIASNSHLVELSFDHGSLNDQSMSSLFRGLTRSSSIKDMDFNTNGLTVEGVRSMVPFLQNSNNLLRLNLDNNNLQSEGFNELFRALRDSPIESLHCSDCGIESVEIEKNAFPKKIENLYLHDNEFGVDDIRGLVIFLQNSNNLLDLDISGNNVTSEGFGLLLRALSDGPIAILICDRCGLDSIKIDEVSIPTRLKTLHLWDNSINADGCSEIAKLLQARSSSLIELSLECNKFGDEGVAILASALQNNATLISLDMHNDAEEITMEGLKMLLKLVNDMTSINGTLQSNHTLQHLDLSPHKEDDTDLIRQQIKFALGINAKNENNPAAAGKEKVIQTQLNSHKRSELCHQLGIGKGRDVLFSEIKSIYLPEVLALISRHHGQGELYAALVPSIAALFSTVNKKQCLQQQRAYYAAKLEAIEAEIAAIEAADDIQ